MGPFENQRNLHHQRRGRALKILNRLHFSKSDPGREAPSVQLPSFFSVVCSLNVLAPSPTVRYP